MRHEPLSKQTCTLFRATFQRRPAAFATLAPHPGQFPGCVTVSTAVRIAGVRVSRVLRAPDAGGRTRLTVPRRPPEEADVTPLGRKQRRGGQLGRV